MVIGDVVIFFIALLAILAIAFLTNSCEKSDTLPTQSQTLFKATYYTPDTIQAASLSLKPNIYHHDSLGHDAVTISWDTTGYYSPYASYVCGYVLVSNPPRSHKGYIVPVTFINGVVIWHPFFYDNTWTQFTASRSVTFYYGGQLVPGSYTAYIVNVYDIGQIANQNVYSQSFTFTAPSY